MNPNDENPPLPGEPAPEDLPREINEADADKGILGDPFSSAPAAAPIQVLTGAKYPPDLQITWSWAHFIIFVLFGFISLLIVQVVLAINYAPHEKLGRQQMEDYLLGKPQFVLGSMVIWYGLIFFFLYITLSVLRGHPFWECLGWRKIGSFNAGPPKGPAFFFGIGLGLSLVVTLLSSRLKAPENAPVEELFKHRETALLFLGMAVLIAPLVEETIFRGYLYPLFARSLGVWPGVLLTGFLFGLMHGAQLGWTLSLVSVLVIVGIIFTMVRAKTGTVLASFMMHLGYNSFIAIVALIGTRGFTKLPPGH
jgi:membrane protease YdiL (CAAX protease family)